MERLILLSLKITLCGDKKSEKDISDVQCNGQDNVNKKNHVLSLVNGTKRIIEGAYSNK